MENSLKITPCDLLWVNGGEKKGTLGLHPLDFDLKKLPEFSRETVTIWMLPGLTALPDNMMLRCTNHNLYQLELEGEMTREGGNKTLRDFITSRGLCCNKGRWENWLAAQNLAASMDGEVMGGDEDV